MKPAVEVARVTAMVVLALAPLLLVGAVFTGHEPEAAFGCGLRVVAMAATRPGARLSVWRLE